MHTRAWIKPCLVFYNFILLDMARDDIFYVDPAFDRYATKPYEGMMKSSRIFAADPKFAGLKFDAEGFIVNDTRGTLNLQQLKTALLGSVEDGKRYAEEHMADGLLRFLDGESIAGDRICYQTFPRSGNTFLRNYMEKITNVPSGSDLDLLTLMPLQLLGQVGEAIADDRVWVTKTHHPGRFNSVDFDSNRIIVTVRNPFDCLYSFTTFMHVWSHST